MSAGTGSSITASRQSSGVADTGNISSGSVIYYGDSLKITATPSANYRISSLTVNGQSFVSGNTHSVSGDVSIASTAQVLASDIGATNADIGSVSTIIVTKYDQSYYHSIWYSFGSISGYIAANGSVSQSEVKFSGTTVAFTIPSSFYNEISNQKTGTCTLTCRTYKTSSSTTVLGTATTCTFTVTASEAQSSPTVSGAVVDTNSVTAYLTGDTSKLVRYKSSAQCTISASARNGATITSKKINGSTPTNNKIVISGDNLYSSSFVFSATDSRGYTTSSTVTPTMIQYVKLTGNPVFSRRTPTSGEVVLTFSGNFFNGSFGSKSNQIAIGYRYRESTASSFGSWKQVAASNITKSSNTYRSPTAGIILEDYNGGTTGFDYTKSYVFEFVVYDGYNPWSSSTYRLSTVTQTATVKEGVPVFDWGKNDFRFNVPVNLGNSQFGLDRIGIGRTAQNQNTLDLAAGWTIMVGGVDKLAELSDVSSDLGDLSNDVQNNYAKKTDLPNYIIGYVDDTSVRPDLTLTNGYSGITAPSSLPSGAVIIAVGAIQWSSSNGFSIIPYYDTNVSYDAYVTGDVGITVRGLKCRWWYYKEVAT